MNNLIKQAALMLIFLTGLLSAQPQFTEIASKPGAFSRMGFGARGIGMGNAMSAVTRGNLVAYYNPALAVFQENNSFQTSYSFLSLDRSLNFLSFTRRFDFYSKKDSLEENPEPRQSAGVSLGIINAGVSDIEERNNDGRKTGDLSTSENQLFLGVALKISGKLALGFGAKLYYFSLYEDISSTGVGLDVGILYKINEEWNIAASLSDLNSKYEWNSQAVYEEEGVQTEDKFPLLKKIGISYYNKETRILVGTEFENSDAGTNIIKIGIEYNIFENLFLRGGVDKFNISNKDAPARPAAGFSYFKFFGNILIGVDYAFMLEPYSSHDRHIVGLNVNF